MIWIILIIIIAYILFKFSGDLNKDKEKLSNTKLDQKFSCFKNELNYFAFNGQGYVTYLNDRSFSLYKDGENQIIYFEFSTGILAITWKYNYYQNEIIEEYTFSNAWEYSDEAQRKAAEDVINDMTVKIKELQSRIDDSFNY